MKKKAFPHILTLLGLLMLAGGLAALRLWSDVQAAPYLGIGFGCGIFGHGAGELLRRRALKNAPDAARQLEIEQNDERNIAVGNRAKARAYDLMIPVFGALFVSFALMGVQMAVILLLVGAYLFVCCAGIYYRIKFEREM